MRSRRHAVFSLLALASACSPREPPVGFTTVELVHHINGKQERETISYGAEGVRISSGDGTFVLRFEGEKVLVLDDVQKTYRETPLADFAAAQKRKQNQPDLPDIVGEVSGSALKVVWGAEPMDFAGVRAKRVQVSAEKLDVELLMTEDRTLPGPRRTTFVFVYALAGPLGLPAELFDQIPGFPVRSIVRVRGGMWEIKVARALTSLDRSRPPQEAFEAPADYRRVD